MLWWICGVYVVIWWNNNPKEYIYAIQAMLILIIAFCNIFFGKESLTRYVINIYACMLGAFQYLYGYTHAQTSIVASESLLRNREIRYIYFKHLLIFYLCFLIGLKLATFIPRLSWHHVRISSCLYMIVYGNPLILIVLYSAIIFFVKYYCGIGVGNVRRGITVPLLGVWVYLMRGINIYLNVILLKYGLNNYRNVKQIYILLIGVFFLNIPDVLLGSRSAIVFPVIETFLVSDLLSKKGIKINLLQILLIITLFFATAALATFRRSGDTLELAKFAIRRFTGYTDGMSSTFMYINNLIDTSWKTFLKKMFLGEGHAVGTIYTEKLGFDIRYMGEAQPGFCIMALLGGVKAIGMFGICVGIIMQKIEAVIRNTDNAVEKRFIAAMLFFNMYMMVIQEGTIEGYLKTNVVSIVIYWCINKVIKISFCGVEEREKHVFYKKI